MQSRLDAAPNSVGLEHMADLLRGNVRLIAMGDSYCSPIFHRVPLAGLRVWPINNISAIGGGATPNSHLIRCTARCNPVSLIQASDGLGYSIERNSSESFFTLPLKGIQEIYTSDTFDDEGTNELFEFVITALGKAYLSNGVHGSFVESGDDVKFRFLYRCPSNPKTQVDEIKIFDGSQDAGILNLGNGARPFWHLGENPKTGQRDSVPRQINASAIDFTANNDTSGVLKIGVEQLDRLDGRNLYFEPAGCVYYKQNAMGIPESGLYYNNITDNSWTYYGFGCDTAGTGTHDKKFSLEQFTYWLDVTTINRNQPTVFMWYLAPETLSYGTAKNLMTNMVDQADQAAALVGLNSVQHLIVISHLFNMTGNIKQDQQYILNHQNAAYDLAANRSNVAAASIYESTDRVMFTGKNAIPWLIDHGFEYFEFGGNTINLVDTSNGDLLDSSNVHPKDPNAAAFYSAILGNIIREAGCTADLITNGVIDVSDLLSLLDGWGEQGSGDLDDDGITNINDLLLLLGQWGACWPVQAPFSTGQFE